MNGKIIEVTNCGSICLLLIDNGRQIVEHAVDHRCMAHIVAGEGIESAQELLGRAVEVGDDGLHFTDETTETEASSPANLIAAEWKGQTHFGY